MCACHQSMNQSSEFSPLHWFLWIDTAWHWEGMLGTHRIHFKVDVPSGWDTRNQINVTGRMSTTFAHFMCLFGSCQRAPKSLVNLADTRQIISDTVYTHCINPECQLFRFCSRPIQIQILSISHHYYIHVLQTWLPCIPSLYQSR